MSCRFAAAALIICAAGLEAQQPLKPHQQFARDVYKELVEINTSVWTAGTTDAAVAMAKRFRDAGFPAADVFVGGPVPHKHNVVLRYRGRGGPAAPKPVLLLAHLDVVEALKADWSPDLEPFKFTEKDGFYYGRGTADDKAMASLFVSAAVRLKQEGYVPQRDIIIALTADEEGGAYNGVDWLLKHHRDRVDAAWVINEGGGGSLRDGKPFLQSVQAAEKVYSDFMFRTTNAGGHSSVPRPDNAIYQLSEALARLSKFSFPVELNPVSRSFFEQTAKVEKPEMAAAMTALVRNPADSTAAAHISKDPRYASMLRTTCVATMLKGGHAPNALPQLAEANVNCRMAPTATKASVQATLQKVAGDPSVVAVLDTSTENRASPPSDLVPEVMGVVERLTREMFGDALVVPTMSTGATDSRYFRALGIPAFGVSGLFSDPTVDARAHGRDERVRIEWYYKAQEFLYQLTRQLSSSAPVP
ncbi:MAG: M20/M25/M40 family metallo-hydrolase [Gemmatimonadetes bacterium]|nr:M20/M25/M40 family metallo-hydrolase [Gemmatimonadota bacterium]